MNKRLTAALLTVFLTMLFACGSAFATVPDAPEPFYAADFANVLEQETEDYITEQNGVLENACGAQIVVVTTDFLDGMDIEDYAYTIFNNWKIGCSYTARAQYGVCAIPAKSYDDIYFPAGNYEALTITLGAGEGENWWCVVFPPLCMVDAADSAYKDNFQVDQQGRLVLKSKIRELLDKRSRYKQSTAS